MSQKNLVNILIINFFILAYPRGIHAQYCLNVGPSTTADSNIEWVSIIGESGSAINYAGCPGVTALNDLTSSESVDLLQGNLYSISIQFGTCGGNYGGAGEAWIDFNQNDIFEPFESIGVWAGTPPTAISVFNFTVPVVPDGQTRMRISQQESTTNPLDPCASFTWGSTTDFLVNIGPPIDCSAYIGDDMDDPREVSSLPFMETHNNDFCYSNVSPVYISSDVFYRIIPADLGITEFNISLCNSTFDTYLEVLDLDTNVIANNDDYGPCAPQSELSFSSLGFDTLFIVVQGWSNEEGDYTIEINDGEFTSLNQNSESISIYPNPSNGEFQLISVVPQIDVTVFSMNGETVYRESNFNPGHIDLTFLDAGVYIIRLNQNGDLTNEKITIK